MEPSKARGRQLVIAVIAISIGASLLSTVLTASTLGTQRIGRDAIRLILNILLCISLYQGKNWARWVVGVLMAIGGIAGILGGLALLSGTPLAFILILMGIAYFVCVYILFFVPSVKAYFQQ
jgi:hypothetical protein